MNYRPLRVGKLIRSELTSILQREVEQEPGVLCTLTGVEVDKKLEHARISVSVMPPGKETEAMKRLKETQGELQYLLMKKLNIKPLPKIEFVRDEGAENAARIEKLLIEEQQR